MFCSLILNLKKTKSTTLHLAAEGGHVEVVRVLLQAGAKATDENAEGYTALHLGIYFIIETEF
jgi:ankyrin repeat protein